MSRVLIAVQGEVTMRAAQSLAAHPGVESISLLGPAKSTYFPTSDDTTDHDIVVGGQLAAQVGLEAGLPAAVSGDLGDQPGLSHGSIAGLALTLAVGVEEVETVAMALPEDEADGNKLMFPSPIDLVPTRPQRVEGHQITVGVSPSSVAAAMVLSPAIHRLILDDHAFMEGISLAAAAATLIEHPDDHGSPVWTRSESYLRTAVAMGLVIAERTPVGGR